VRKTLLAGMTLLIAFQTLTPSFKQRHTRDVAQNPPDVSFVLSTKDGQNTFHPGEAIPVVLEFSSSAPNKYRLNGATYDRSGRLRIEEFVLDREDVIDPLRDYFGTGVMGGIAGGLRGYPILETQPYRIELFLNDWFRFETPGKYRLYLKSHRLSRERLISEPGESRLIDFAPVSNILTLNISEPDPAWEAGKLADLEAVFESPKKPPEEELDRARKELTYLGSPDAIRLIFARARHSPDELDSFALISSPHRDLVIDEFDRFVAEPDTVLSSWIIRLRTLFDYVRKYSPKPLPMYFWEVPPVDRDKLLEAIEVEMEARRKQFEGMLRERAIGYIPLIGGKSEAARDESARSIAELAPAEAKAAGLVEPEDFGMTRVQLIASFEFLAEDRQWALLTKKWGLVRGPDMLPVLTRVVERASPKRLPPSADGYSLWHGATGIAEIALQRLFQMAPEEGKRIVLRDIATSMPRFPYFAVSELPAQNIREADPVFAENLKGNPAGTIPLIAKFGTSTLAIQVRSTYLAKKWSCAEEQWFVAYLMRVLSTDEARNILTHAMSLRTDRGCFRGLLPGVGRVTWNSLIEQEAVAKLDDPDPEVAANAASALARFGSIKAESSLWRRLEQWSNKWRGRTEELLGNPITDATPNEERLGSTLFDSIAQARAWYLDEDRSQRLLSLCIDEDCRERWTDERKPEIRQPVVVSASSGVPVYGPAYRVAQYSFSTFAELKDKLTQFPPGTTFRWCTDESPLDSLIPEERDEVYSELVRFLARRASRIEPYSKVECR